MSARFTEGYRLDSTRQSIIGDPRLDGIKFAFGATVPSDAATGYATGCLFLQSDGGVGTAVYVNEGTTASADFNPIALPGTSLLTLLATADEINRAADVSTRLVDATAATLAVTVAEHDGKTILLNKTGGITVTLPAAVGSGARFKFVVKTVSTTGYVIQVTTDDTMNGQFMLLDNDAAAQASYAAIGGDDTLTMNGTTKGGQIGDVFFCEDIATDVWGVYGWGVVPAGSNPADPFSAAVT